MGAKSNISLYWKCQLVGWSVAAIYWAFAAIINGNFDPWFGLIQFLTDVAVYIGLTHLYRNFVLRHQWQLLSIEKLGIRLIPALAVMGCLYTIVTLLKLALLREIFIPGYDTSFFVFVQMNFVNILVAGIRLMAIWLLAYHLYQYAWREIYFAKENARLAIESRDAQLNNLTSQLNPHFLFNALNTIKSLVSRKPSTARRGIDLLSGLLRNAIQVSDSYDVLIVDELAIVADYLELEKIRMEERLEYSIMKAAGFKNIMIPRLSILTLVENAVKHGISQNENGGRIDVSITEDNNSVFIVVINTGRLRIHEQTYGVGLQNLVRRLDIIYKGSADFLINETNGNVTAQLIIPIV